MKILLDHCVDWHLGRSLPTHTVKSAQGMGWDALQNGKLLAAAATDFEVFLTVDRNLKYQQNLDHLPIAVVVLIGRTNRLAELQKLIPDVELLPSLRPCSLVEIDASHKITGVAAGK